MLEFDTLGTWDTRLDVQINEDASIRTGTVVPDIDINMIGTFTNQGRRTYQEDRFVVKMLRPDLLYCAVFDGHGGSRYIRDEGRDVLLLLYVYYIIIII